MLGATELFSSSNFGNFSYDSVGSGAVAASGSFSFFYSNFFYYGSFSFSGLFFVRASEERHAEYYSSHEN